MEEPKTPEQVRILLEKYHDIPAMIAEEEAVIRHCNEQMQVIALSGVCVNGLPGGRGQASDPTANMAQGQAGEYEQEISACNPRITIAKMWERHGQDRPIYDFMWHGLSVTQAAEFHEMMMGFPPHWTDLNVSEMR